jgi:excisionase family DNA binding protein
MNHPTPSHPARETSVPSFINSTPTATPPPSDVLDVKGAAVLLLINRVTVTEYAQAGTIPGRLIGNRWRFSRACLMRWLEASAAA